RWSRSSTASVSRPTACRSRRASPLPPAAPTPATAACATRPDLPRTLDLKGAVMKKRISRSRKRRRNAGPFTPRRASGPRGARPDWKTTLAALAGGAGSAALGGLVVNQEILSPETVGLGMIGLGGATAYFADGNTRIVGNSVAAAGAGQLALALMAKKALGMDRATASAAPARPTTPATLPAGP